MGLPSRAVARASTPSRTGAALLVGAGRSSSPSRGGCEQAEASRRYAHAGISRATDMPFSIREPDRGRRHTHTSARPRAADSSGVSRKLVGVGAVVLLAIPASHAGAYELQLAPSGEAVRWHRDPVLTEITMDPAPAGLDATAAEAAVRRALATWTQAGAPEFVPAGSEQEPVLRVRFAMNPHDPA